MYIYVHIFTYSFSVTRYLIKPKDDDDGFIFGFHLQTAGPRICIKKIRTMQSRTSENLEKLGQLQNLQFANSKNPQERFMVRAGARNPKEWEL